MLVSFSVICQIIAVIILVIVGKLTITPPTALTTPAEHKMNARIDFLNNVATVMIALTVVLNIFITAFGVNASN